MCIRSTSRCASQKGFLQAPTLHLAHPRAAAPPGASRSVALTRALQLKTPAQVQSVLRCSALAWRTSRATLARSCFSSSSASRSAVRLDISLMGPELLIIAVRQRLKVSFTVSVAFLGERSCSIAVPKYGSI
jgi:hypothetical protein